MSKTLVKLEKIREMHDSRERMYGASTLSAHVMHRHIAILLERIEELEAGMRGLDKAMKSILAEAQNLKLSNQHKAGNTAHWCYERIRLHAKSLLKREARDE